MRRASLDDGKDCKIICEWEEIAIALKMPESVYRRKKERALKILDDAYIVAKDLGYLLSYSREGNIDTLILNEQKYYSSNITSQPTVEHKKSIERFSVNAYQLLELFNEEKLENDPKYKISESQKSTFLKEFDNLLQIWSKEDIEKVICWGLRLKLWHDRLNTPKKIRQNINKSIEAMKIQY